MLSTKQIKKIKEDVVKAYKEKYPKWTGIEVTEIVENSYFDVMVAVKSIEFADGEICVYRNDGVRIFDTTPELVRYLEMKAKSIVSFKEKLIAIIVISMLIIFAGVVFIQKDQNATALVTTSMAGILGTFVGVKLNTRSKD